MLASIPSPGDNVISLGPLDLRAYGILIALGALTAVWLTQRRYEAAGGDPLRIQRLAMWAIPAGIIGARAYHVATDFDRFRDDFWEAFRIWGGGLGIWGAISAGALVGWWLANREGWDKANMLDAAAPAIPLAQAIGRLGNWFNQELFGRPSDLPWALEIDPEHRPAEYLDVETFHPTFLYEMIWNLAVAAFLIFVVPRVLPRLRDGGVFALYVVGYTFGRLWIELVRIDPASEVLGQRVNVWVSLLVMAGGLVAVWRLRGGRAEVEPDPEPAEPTA